MHSHQSHQSLPTRTLHTKVPFSPAYIHAHPYQLGHELINLPSGRSKKRLYNQIPTSVVKCLWIHNITKISWLMSLYLITFSAFTQLCCSSTCVTTTPSKQCIHYYITVPLIYTYRSANANFSEIHPMDVNPIKLLNWEKLRNTCPKLF